MVAEDFDFDEGLDSDFDLDDLGLDELDDIAGDDFSFDGSDNGDEVSLDGLESGDDDTEDGLDLGDLDQGDDELDAGGLDEGDVGDGLDLGDMEAGGEEFDLGGDESVDGETDFDNLVEDSDSEEAFDLGELDTDELDLGEMATEDEETEAMMDVDEDLGLDETDSLELDSALEELSLGDEEAGDEELSFDDSEDTSDLEESGDESIQFDVEGKVDELDEGLGLETEIVAEESDVLEEVALEESEESEELMTEEIEEEPEELMTEEDSIELSEEEIDADMEMEEDSIELSEEEIDADMEMEEEATELLLEETVEEDSEDLEMEEESEALPETHPDISTVSTSVGLDALDLEQAEMEAVGIDNEPALDTPPAETTNAMETAVSAVGLGKDLLLNINHNLSVEVGRTQMPGSDITELTYGSVIELDKIAGDPVDLVLNGKVVAQGEVVLINHEKIGIRVIGINQD